MTGFSDSSWLPMDTFDELPDDALLVLENCLEERHFAQGDHLIRQGDIGEEMFVITSGHAMVMTEDHEGQRYAIARTGPGDVLGEMALLAREPRTADAIAQEPLVAQVLAASAFHSLIETYPEFSRFLTRLMSTRVGGKDRDVLVGRDMHGHHITRRLGRGGMAVVYEAIGPAGDTVALKMLSHRLVCDEHSRDLFQREADIIETFDHPNIVNMRGRFEMFYTYFIIVEYIDGMSLHELIRNNGPLPEEDVRAILGQLVMALDYAHRSEIIHRDIKPGNVMVGRDGQVKLMDFGLAKPTGTNSDVDRLLVGTPGYIAPELFKGNQPGPEIDLFAMGCLAVELLVGRKLFGQKTIADFVETVSDWGGWDRSTLGFEIEDNLAEVINGWLEPLPENRAGSLKRVGSWAAEVVLPEDVEIIDVADQADVETGTLESSTLDPTWLADEETDSTEAF